MSSASELVFGLNDIRANQSRDPEFKCSRTPLLPIHFLVCIALAISTVEAQATTSYSQIVAFGDSYSDSGNVGRSTEEENWLEYMSTGLGIASPLRPSNDGGSNFSRGTGTATGTMPADLEAQVAAFHRDTIAADPDALYVIWIGLNDIQQSKDVADLQLFANEIVGSIEAAMESIWAAGGRHFLVPNAWDFATTPLSLFREPGRNLEQAAIHLLFNESLDFMLGAFAEPVHRLNAFGLSRDIAADPVRYGFVDNRSRCPIEASTCDGFMWRDFIHPTSGAHRFLADLALTAIPEPSSALMVGLGLFVLGAKKRRQRGTGPG